jgi:hypothetical protein
MRTTKMSAVLCLALSPLLMAQQTAAPSSSAAVPARVDLDLTREGQVRFLSPGLASLARIRRGRTVQFELSADATFGNDTLIHAGVPVTGVVTRVKHASRFQQRDGQISIKVTEMLSGKSADIVVRCVNPADPFDKPYSAERVQKYAPIVVIGALVAAYIVVAIKRPE